MGRRARPGNAQCTMQNAHCASDARSGFTLTLCLDITTGLLRSGRCQPARRSGARARLPQERAPQ